MMKTGPMPLLLAAATMFALGGCGRDDKAATEKRTSIAINHNGDDDDGKVTVNADTETGRMELKLPGGFEAKVAVPSGLSGNTKFDIDGVGLYPGAKVRTVKVNARDRGGDHDATVELGFRAPADAAAVADWYQQQFEAKKVAVRRSGETLTGKTEDGNDFTLALAARSEGGSDGTLTIRDVRKG